MFFLHSARRLSLAFSLSCCIFISDDHDDDDEEQTGGRTDQIKQHSPISRPSSPAARVLGRAQFGYTQTELHEHEPCSGEFMFFY